MLIAHGSALLRPHLESLINARCYPCPCDHQGGSQNHGYLKNSRLGGLFAFMRGDWRSLQVSILDAEAASFAVHMVLYPSYLPSTRQVSHVLSTILLQASCVSDTLNVSEVSIVVQHSAVFLTHKLAGNGMRIRSSVGMLSVEMPGFHISSEAATTKL